MILKSDCRHFPGDKPCIFNKRDGLMCDDCPNFSELNFKILIIKLDATGDVLRTTAILPALKRKYPDSHITWLTKKSSSDIFKNNDAVDRVLAVEDAVTNAILSVERFDLCIHPDASPTSAALFSLANAKTKKGFGLSERGKVIPFNNEAIEWFEMGAFDQLKKKNTKTYQQIIHEIIGLDYNRDEIQIFLSQDELNTKETFSQKHDLQKYDFVLGLNTGAGSRWQFKQWRLDGYIELIEKVKREFNAAVLLYGGPEEVERNLMLTSRFPDLIDTGTDNTLRQFFAKVDLCDIMITGDTLALHTAAALKKQIICLFGPTSSNEIEDYGRITKIFPEMDCLVCYKMRCDFSPNCMDLITVDMVFEALQNSLKQNGKN
ncbi:MAG: glycosyltransferase family 9 protein [bacterium]